MTPARDRGRVRRLETRDEAAKAARAARADAALSTRADAAGTGSTGPAPEGPAKPDEPEQATGGILVDNEALAEPPGGPALEPAAAPTVVGRAPAGYSVGGRLGELLEPVFAAEPPVGDAVAAIFGRAERLRRRRSRKVFAAGVIAVLLVFALGYGLTTVLLPAAARPAPTSTVYEPPRPDPVREVFRPVLAASGLRIVPREPARGNGWRQYLVLNAGGRPHGLIEVSVYAAPGGLCFPVLADKTACARPDRAAGGVEYVRYLFDRDVDWQVNQVIARRLSDGRVVVVQATGERGTGTADGGRPPLSALLTAKTATDPRLVGAFGRSESCNGPDPACPILRVPVPVTG